MLHVLVTIQGGNVQQTICNSENILVTIIDYDNPSISTGKADRVVSALALRNFIEGEQHAIKNEAVRKHHTKD